MVYVTSYKMDKGQFTSLTEMVYVTSYMSVWVNNRFLNLNCGMMNPGNSEKHKTL